MAEDPKQSLQEAYRKRRDDLRVRADEESRIAQARHAEAKERVSAELSGARDRLLGEWNVPAHRLTIVFCTNCGHVVAATASPEDRAEGEKQVVEALHDLTDSLHAMHRDLVSCLEAVGGRLRNAEAQVAALNAREEARDQAARTRAAVSAAAQLLSG